jgi:hypothetical protein
MVVVVEVHMAREKCVMYDVRVSQNGSRNNIRMAPIPILGTTSLNRSFTEWEVGILGWLQLHQITPNNTTFTSAKTAPNAKQK